MKSFFYRFAEVFSKNKKTSKYKEIFSTTENKLNLQNTSPLDIPDEQLDSDCFNVRSLFHDEFSDKTRTSEFLSEEITVLYPEYTNPLELDAAKDISKILKKEIKSLKVKSFTLSIFFILSFILDVLIRIKPAFLSSVPVNTSALYSISSLFILLLSFIVGFKIIKHAFIHVSYAVFAPDTAVIFPLITTFLNCVISLVFSFFDASFQTNNFVSLFIFNFILIVLNPLFCKKRILNNFKLVTSSKQKYNIDMYDLNELISPTSHKKKLFTAYQYKTNFLTNFIRNSHRETLSEHLISKIIPFSIIFSVLCGILSLIFTKSPTCALAALNISSLTSVPFAMLFLVNFNVSALCKYTMKNRTMIIGENAIKRLSNTKSIVLNDSDLYPPNNVVLRGIKTFNGQRIDEAILYAAAVVCHINAPVSKVFDKIIMGKRTILTNASGIVYKEEKGVVGWVNGKRILVGNRELLKEFKIVSPSRDYEKKYRIPNCELTYFAIGRELVAMFILEYTPSKSLRQALSSCIKNNIKVFIKTVDSNLTLSKISADFGLNEKFLTLLSYDDSQKINKLYNKTENHSNAFLATLDSCVSLVKSIGACCFAKNNIILVTAIQGLQLILNTFLILYLIICSGLSELHTLELTIYSLLWFIFTAIASKIKKFKY